MISFLVNTWSFIKSNKKYLTLFLLFLTLNTFAQNSQIYTYGTVGSESANSILNLNDGTYIIGARNNAPDMLLMHVNNNGTIIKQAVIQSTHSITKLIKLSNGDYLIVGSESSAEQTTTIMIRINSSFNIIWSKQLSATNLAYSFSVIECSNGDLMAVGYSSFTGVSNSDWDCLAYRLNSTGNLLWKKTIKTSVNSDWLVDLVELPSGNIVAVGASVISSVNYLLLKFNQSGTILAKKQFEASLNEVMYSPIFYNNKLYITAGTWSFNIGQYDVSFLRLDTNFILEKSTVFGGLGIDFPMHSLIKNNELNIVAYSNTFDANYDLLLFNLDLDGNLKKSKRIGGAGRELLFTKGDLFTINNNNTYTITGETNTYGNGSTDIFMSTFDLNQNCCGFYSDITSSISKVNGVYTQDSAFSMTENLLLNTFSNVTKTVSNTITLTKDSNCINLPITANISADTIICINQPIGFTIGTNALNANYSWNFDDPSSGPNNLSNIASPNHTFLNDGIYEVICEVNSDCSIALDTIRIRVINNGKTNTIIANTNSSYCINSPVPFFATNSQIGVSYNWTFDDPSSGILNFSNNQNSTHLFTDTGSFNVVLISQFQCYSDTDTVKINIISDDSLNATIDTTFHIDCINNSVDFESIIQGNATIYLWNFGDPNSGINNSSTLANPSHNFSQPGTYQVFLVVENNCFKDTSNIEVVIPNFQPLITSLNSTPIELCLKDTLNLSFISNQSDVKAYWNFGDGTLDTSTNNSVTHKYLNSGNYTIQLITKTLCYSDTDIINITIIDKPIVSISTDTTDFCSGELVVFTSNVIGDFTDVLWKFNDPNSGTNDTSTLLNPSHTFTTPGNYTIMFIVNSNCSVDTNYVSIKIIDKINLVTTINNIPRTYCKGDTLKISVNSNDSSATYLWDFDDPNSGPNNFANGDSAQHVFNNFGVYNIKLRTTNECDSKLDTINIYIIEPIAPDFNFYIDTCLKVLTLENLSNGIENNNFNWTLNDQLLSVEKNTSAMLNQNGIYKIRLTMNPNTNCQDSIIKVITFNLPPIDLKLDIPNTFSPNNDGINDIFYIKGATNCEVKKMIIFNRWGKVLYESTTLFTWNGKNDNGDFPPGTYILYLEIGSNTVVKTINLMH